MIINVTQEHIDKGIATQPCLCAISLAIREQARLKDAAVVADVWRPNLDYIYYPLPVVARDFAYAFDRGEKVSPFSFELEIPV